MEGLGVSDDAMLLIRRKVSVAGRCASWPFSIWDLERRYTHPMLRTAEQDAEMMRLQILGNPHLMRELQQVLYLSHCMHPF